jgi:hypothetical protein
VIGAGLTEQELAELMELCRDLDVFPFELPYFIPKKASHPVADLLSGLIEKCARYLDKISAAEVDALIHEIPEPLRFYVNKRAGSGRRERLESIALSYIEAAIYERYFKLADVLTANASEGKVFEKYPELRRRIDKHGLLHVDDSVRLTPHGILYRDHLLHYHQLLRKHFTSNFNFELLDSFIRYHAQQKNTLDSKQDGGSPGAWSFRIAIDANRLMPKRYLRLKGEKEVWFGPRFDETKLDKRHDPLLTCVKNTIPELYRSFFADVDRTEFRWAYRNSDAISEFEIEEVSNESNARDGYILNRYVHSERDMKRRVMRHFDGAVKVYSYSDYSARLSSQLPTEPKCYRKIKLFRIDGDIDTATWIDLIAKFYLHNPMILEYFDPEQYEALLMGL